MVELVDTLGLGASLFRLGVQVPLLVMPTLSQLPYFILDNSVGREKEEKKTVSYVTRLPTRRSVAFLLSATLLVSAVFECARLD